VKIKKGDRVVVLTGTDQGNDGEVVSAYPKDGKVVVAGVNTATKHKKRTSAMAEAGLMRIDMPIDVSNVALISPSDGKPTRVGYKIADDGTKTRVCKRTGAELS
jgi:large subunit ribosomal protein L24